MNGVPVAAVNFTWAVPPVGNRLLPPWAVTVNAVPPTNDRFCGAKAVDTVVFSCGAAHVMKFAALDAHEPPPASQTRTVPVVTLTPFGIVAIGVFTVTVAVMAPTLTAVT